jgi:hypothetical protein
MRPEYVWAVRQGHVMRRGGQAFNLAGVDAASWGDVSYRGTRSAWLDLQAGSQKLRLECSEGGLSQDRGQFIGLVIAVLDELDQRSPRLGVRYDQAGVYGRAMFILGLLLGLVGAICVYAGLADFGSARAWGVFAVGAGAIAGCSVLTWTHRPWRPSGMARPAELKALLTVQESQRP